MAGWVAVGSGGEDFVKLGGDEAGVVPGVWGAFQQLVGEGGEAVQGESAAGVLESGLISGGEAAEEYLHAGDVVGWEGEEPGSGAAQYLVCGGGGGA